MDRLLRASLIAEVADNLYFEGKGCGETHLQKTIFFLQELYKIPFNLKYIRYMYGPFSFELREDLYEMVADFLLKRESRETIYGHRYIYLSTDESKRLRQRFHETVEGYSPKIKTVSDYFSSLSVKELEARSMALWVSLENINEKDVPPRAEKIHNLKPHLALEDIRSAVEATDRMIKEAPLVHPALP